MAKDFKPSANNKALVDGWITEAKSPPKKWQHIVLHDLAHDLPGLPQQAGLLVTPEMLSTADRHIFESEWNKLQLVQATDFKAPPNTRKPFGPDVATLILTNNPAVAPSFALGIEDPAPKPNTKYTTQARHHIYNSGLLFDSLSHFIREMHLEPIRLALYRTPEGNADVKRTAIFTLTVPQSHQHTLQHIQQLISTERASNITHSLGRT